MEDEPNHYTELQSSGSEVVEPAAEVKAKPKRPPSKPKHSTAEQYPTEYVGDEPKTVEAKPEAKPKK